MTSTTTPRRTFPDSPSAADDHPEAAHRGQQLSLLDGSFFRVESASAHMHVGWSAVFDPPTREARPTVEALRARAAARAHFVPWCRWRLHRAPFGLSEPRWADYSSFDVAEHIVALSGPDEEVDYERFELLRERVLSEPLDDLRPLWQMCLIPRLEDGRIGLVGKIHHGLVDGMAALQVVGLVIDLDPDPTPAVPVSWKAGAEPNAGDWLVDAFGRPIGTAIRTLGGTATAAVRPRAVARTARGSAGRMLRAVGHDVLPRAPDSRLNVSIGPRRTLVGYHAEPDEVKATRAGGGTLNDVGIAVVAGALRTLFVNLGDPVSSPLKAMIPVNMRASGELGAGNRIAMAYVDIPVHIDDARDRLESVREQTQLLKRSDRPAGLEQLVRIGRLIPPPLRTPVAHAFAAPRRFNLTISQSPAPMGPIHVLGCELREVYSVVPIVEGHALAVGLVRYRQGLFFGCYADPVAFPSVYELPALLEAEVRALRTG